MLRPDIYRNKNTWKLILFLVAALIGAGTLWYTEGFLKELRAGEVRSVRIWAQALKSFSSGGENTDFTLVSMIIQQNKTIPIIVTDESGRVITHGNLDSSRIDNPGYIEGLIPDMREDNEPIVVEFAPNRRNIVYYSESILLKQLRIYPIVLLGVIGLFVGIAYLAFSSARRSEQNRVWTGMARETAHQIATPLSSLMGWIEFLRERGADGMALEEMNKDVLRLETITERFSKIGSIPQIHKEDVVAVVKDSLKYLRARTSKKIDIRFSSPEQAVIIPLNPQLFTWVIENLVRNAIDAIEGKGSIDLRMTSGGKHLRIDIEDSGKGIQRNQFQAVFRPGYTSKSRGWGLGLSLAKRIVEDYHRGKIFVHRSEPGAGTTFRILLPYA